MVFSYQKPVIGCVISDAWAGEQCKRVVEEGGGRLLVIPPEILDLPVTLGYMAACIYDLAPWDITVPSRLHRLRDVRPEMPLLFYLPPSPDAVALVSDCGQLPNVRFRVQLRRCEELRRFEQDARWLLRSIPQQEILDTLANSFPSAPPIMRPFCCVVLRRLSVGMRCTVDQIAKDVGVSGRTIQRHLTSNLLGTPKEMIDRLTVWYLLHLSRSASMSLARAARSAGMVPNEFYRLKRRVLESIADAPSRPAWESMTGEYLAPRQRAAPRASCRLPLPVSRHGLWGARSRSIS